MAGATTPTANGTLRAVTLGWLRGVDLNHRPLGYEPNELPDCSTPQCEYITPSHCGAVSAQQERRTEDVWHPSAGSRPALGNPIAAPSAARSQPFIFWRSQASTTLVGS